MTRLPGNVSKVTCNLLHFLEQQRAAMNFQHLQRATHLMQCLRNVTQERCVAPIFEATFQQRARLRDHEADLPCRGLPCLCRDFRHSYLAL